MNFLILKKILEKKKKKNWICSVFDCLCEFEETHIACFFIDITALFFSQSGVATDASPWRKVEPPWSRERDPSWQGTSPMVDSPSTSRREIEIKIEQPQDNSLSLVQRHLQQYATNQ